MGQGDLLRRITEVKDAELARMSKALQGACAREEEARNNVVEHRAIHSELEQAKLRVRGSKSRTFASRPPSALERQCEHRYEVALVADIAEAERRLAVAESELDQAKQVVLSLREQVETLTAQQLHAKRALRRMEDARQRSAEQAREDDALEAWQVKPGCN